MQMPGTAQHALEARRRNAFDACNTLHCHGDDSKQTAPSSRSTSRLLLRLLSKPPTWRAWISAIFCLRMCALPRRCSAMCSALVVVMLQSEHTCGPAPHSTFRWCRLPARCACGPFHTLSTVRQRSRKTCMES